MSDSIGVLEAGTIDVCNSISGHSATYIHASFTYNLGNTYKRTVWFCNTGDFDKLNDLIGTNNWDFLTEGDLDTACTNFTSSLMKFIKQCVPF